MILTAFAELIGVASIMPFMAVAATPDLISTNSYLNAAYVFLGEPGVNIFLIYIGLVFIFLIFLSNGLLLVSQFLMNRYAHRLGGEFSANVYAYYLNKNILFHNRKNSADLTQHIMRDTLRISTHLVAPALRLNGRVFSIVLLSLLIIYVDVYVAFSTLFCLVLVYSFVFYALRSRIYTNGQHISGFNATRNKLLNESFEGLKDIKLYRAESQLIKQFTALTRKVSRALAENMILGQSPYYLVETVMLIGILLITLYFIVYKGGIETVLPVLTLYCMAGFKLVPKVQQSYLAITQIRSAQPVFHSLYGVLEQANRESTKHTEDVPVVRLDNSIALDDICYCYPGSSEPLLEHVSLEITVGEMIAITGRSGAGKSTLLEIIMGLIEPDSGLLRIDSMALDPGNIAGWQKAVGFVPQVVYLTDATIAENIAFGVLPESIDMKRVRSAARQAAIASYIEDLPEGYNTLVGERGALLSGGQRQRLGIARALYRDVSVLVLDEATSALDNQTQGQVFCSLRSREKTLTVIMVTHRAETLQFANRIYEVRGGELRERTKVVD